MNKTFTYLSHVSIDQFKKNGLSNVHDVMNMMSEYSLAF